VPSAQPVLKYGGKLFTVTPEINESQFCGVFIYKHHVQISFSRGALLHDRRGILSGNGKRRRHLNFTSLELLDLDYVAELLEEAVEL
jgi:hypothetical protein